MKAERKIDYRHIICVLITLGFVALGIFRFFGCSGFAPCKGYKRKRLSDGSSVNSTVRQSEL